MTAPFGRGLLCGAKGRSPSETPHWRWERGPATPLLEPGDVHVWVASVDRPPQATADLWNTLAPDERARAEGLVFARDRDRYVAGRALLREIIGKYLRADPAALAFVYGAHGKPALRSDTGALRFNASGSDGVALIALSRNGAVGVDVERIRPLPDAPQLVERFFAADEVRTLRSLRAEDFPKAFFSTWTRKEAYIKGLGVGLALPLNRFEVALDTPGLEPMPVRARDGRHETLWLRSLEPAVAYVGAVASDVPGMRLQCWRWW